MSPRVRSLLLLLGAVLILGVPDGAARDWWGRRVREFEVAGMWVESADRPGAETIFVEDEPLRVAVVALAGPDWSGLVAVRVKVKGRTDGRERLRERFTHELSWWDGDMDLDGSTARMSTALPSLPAGLYRVKVKLVRARNGDRVAGKGRFVVNVQSPANE